MKSEREIQIPYANTYIWEKKKKSPDEPSCRAGVKMQTKRMGLRTQGRRGNLGRSSIDIYTLPNVK